MSHHSPKLIRWFLCSFFCHSSHLFSIRGVIPPSVLSCLLTGCKLFRAAQLSYLLYKSSYMLMLNYNVLTGFLSWTWLYETIELSDFLPEIFFFRKKWYQKRRSWGFISYDFLKLIVFLLSVFQGEQVKNVGGHGRRRKKENCKEYKE